MIGNWGVVGRKNSVCREQRHRILGIGPQPFIAEKCKGLIFANREAESSSELLAAE